MFLDVTFGDPFLAFLINSGGSRRQGKGTAYSLEKLSMGIRSVTMEPLSLNLTPMRRQMQMGIMRGEREIQREEKKLRGQAVRWSRK